MSRRWRPWSPSGRNLIVYLSKARPTLEEVSADVQRVRGWLENEQRTHWENEVRRRSQALEEAQQALFSAKLSNLPRGGRSEQMVVHRAKRALDEADAKLRVVKQWSRVFGNRVDPLVKQMEKLHTVLANDMVQAVAFLTQAIQTLDAYAEIAPPAAAGPAPARGRRRGTGEANHEGERLQAGGPHQGTAGPVAGHEELLEGRQEPGIRAQVHGRTLGQRGPGGYSDRSTGQACNQDQEGL